MSTNWTMPPAHRSLLCVPTTIRPRRGILRLSLRDQRRYERHDYCLNCGVPITPVPIGSWRTRRPMPRSSSVPTFDREAVYRFFERLEGSDEPQRIQFRFLLALLLWRKKVIKLERTMTLNDTEIWNSAHPPRAPPTACSGPSWTKIGSKSSATRSPAAHWRARHAGRPHPRPRYGGRQRCLG